MSTKEESKLLFQVGKLAGEMAMLQKEVADLKKGMHAKTDAIAKALKAVEDKVTENRIGIVRTAIIVAASGIIGGAGGNYLLNFLHF